MNKRAIVLVLDGFGVGVMPDIETRPQDQGANTFRHVAQQAESISLPELEVVGAVEYYINGMYLPSEYRGAAVSFGKAALAHFGADSFVGHQEIAGTEPKEPVRQFVRDEKDAIIAALTAEGYIAEFKEKIIIVNEHVAIADNIETDYGLNINVVGSMDYMPYSEIERIGRIVRAVVKVGRVITMGGVNLEQSDFYDCLEINTRDGYEAWGINIPKLDIYNESYHVIHMGYGIDPQTQVPSIVLRAGMDVTLIGKTADVIDASGAKYMPQVYTDKVIEHLLDEMNSVESGFIFANVQETDLSGHQMNLEKYAHYLQMIDTALPKIIDALQPGDLFIITGDHGNDPTIEHTNHTREYTPIMMFSKGGESRDIGTRETLADIGAAVSEYLGVETPGFGTSFLLENEK